LSYLFLKLFVLTLRDLSIPDTYFCVSGRLKAITELPLSGECAAPPTEITMYCLPVTGDT